MRFKRAIITALVVCLILLVSAVSAIYVVAKTDTGSKWLLDQLIQRAAIDLSYENMSGNFVNGLSVEKMSYRQAEQVISINGISIRLALGHLLEGQLRATELLIDSIVIDRGEKKVVKEPLMLPDIRPPLRFAIERLSITTVSIVGVDEIYGPISAQATMTDRIRVEDLRVANSKWLLTAQGWLLPHSEYRLSFEGALKSSSDAWQVDWRIDESLARLNVDARLVQPQQVSASGEVLVLNQIAPQFDLTMKTDQWLQSDVLFSDVSLHALGQAGDYKLVGNSNLRVPKIPDATINFEASGSQKGLTVGAIDYLSQYGDAKGQGQLIWAPSLAIDLQGQVSKFNAAFWRDDIETALAANWQFDFSSNDDFSVLVKDIDGRINGIPVQGQLNLRKKDNQFQFSESVLESGGNAVTASGFWSSERLAVDWHAEASDLSLIDARLNGVADMKGAITGTIDHPVWTIKALSPTLSYESWSVRALDAKLNFDAQSSWKSQIQAEGLRYQEKDLGALDVSADGRKTQAGLNLSLTGGTVSLSSDISMSFNGAGIDGRVARAEVATELGGRFELEQPFDYQVAQERIEIGAHRWQHPTADISVHKFLWSDGNVEARASARQIPLASLDPWLPIGWQLEGEVQAQMELSGALDNLQGSAEITQSGMRVFVPDPEFKDGQLAIPIQQATATVALDGSKTILDVVLAAEDGRINANLTASGFAKDANVVGAINIDLDDLPWVAGFSRYLSKTKGSLVGTMNVAGTLSAPRYRGEVRLRDAETFIRDAGVTVSNIDLQMVAANSQFISIDGSANSGPGQVSIKGEITDIATKQRKLSMKIDGERFEVVRLPEYQALANTEVSILLTDEQARVDGSLLIPEATITLPEIPEGAVAVSRDVVVINRKEPLTKPLPINGRIRLTLGDEVSFSALGLESRVEGSLNVTFSTDVAPRAEGQLELKEGVFRAYGQNLSIDGGTLIYTGPLDNPIIDIRAARDIRVVDGTQTVGIHLTGRSQDIQSELYSVPTVSQADALSYLVIGRPLYDASASEGETLQSAALQFGVQQALPAISQLYENLGIDELYLAGDADAQRTALVAGKQVNEDFYLRYTYGVFSRVGALLIRYQLNDRFSIEASAGEAQSMDVIYSLEKP